ncbi:MAG TPA: YceI family protein [Bacteroidia bacterium]|jgi:polyisoprenoid-binding protein YceI|nr:YceI family protein [Bacteroidia bacterium]
MKKTMLLFLLPAMLAFVYIGVKQWKLSETYSVTFSSPDISGRFKTIKAEIAFDEKDLKGSFFNAQVDVNSLETGNPSMNSTATSEDMLDAKKFPNILFRSTTVEKKDTSYITRGILDMHGTKKEISIPFSFHGKIFTGTFTVACSAYGMKGAGKGASDTVKIRLSIPVTEK